MAHYKFFHDDDDNNNNNTSICKAHNVSIRAESEAPDDDDVKCTVLQTHKHVYALYAQD